MDEPDVRHALSALIDRAGESYAALSRLLGRNPAYLQQFVTRGSPRRLAERDRRLLASYFGVDEQILGGPAGRRVADTRVPRIDVAASAGAGALVEDDRLAGSRRFDPLFIAGLGAKPENLSVIRASGRSMEPTISDGDELLVDRGDRRIGSRAAIHVIRVDGALMVKRVARAGPGYRVTSDNPDFAPVEHESLDVIGRVVWLSRALK